RHAGRPRGAVLPHLPRGRDRGLGHRGLRAAHLPHPREAARGRSLRRPAPRARRGPPVSGAELLLALGELGAAPSPSDGGESNQVTASPGLPGFFPMCALAVVVVLLAGAMTRRTRRVQAQARVKERMEALQEDEERAAQEQEAAEGDEDTQDADADDADADADVDPDADADAQADDDGPR